jgi:hypothetical protein
MTGLETLVYNDERGARERDEYPGLYYYSPFETGLIHFRGTCRSCVDFWHLYDNSGEYPLLLEEGAN